MISSVASSRVRFLASAAAAALMASMLAGCKTTGTVDRFRRTRQFERLDAHGSRLAPRGRRLRGALPRQSARRRECDLVCASAAGHGGGARRPRPCSKPPRSTRPIIPGCRRLRARARGCRQPQAGAGVLDVRTNRTRPTGASCRCRARCSTRWVGMKKRSATTRARCASCRTSRRCCPTWDSPYALSKDLKRAEDTLRRASVNGRGDKRVRQNLALVVGLQGRTQEAEQLAQADLRRPGRRERRRSARANSQQKVGAATSRPLKRSIRARAIPGLDPPGITGS